MKKIVLGLSGGADSLTLLGLLLKQGHEVHCCIFTYEAKHNQYEIGAARKIIFFYKYRNKPIHAHYINISGVMKGFKSDLLLTGGEIPEGDYKADSMKSTVVPGRNLIFASIMAGLAESIEADFIALGVHAGDHHIYPDCRPEFIYALQEVIDKSSESKLAIHTPLIDKNKADIIKTGLSLSIKVPYHLSRTCYKNQPIACGKCGSCVERLEAFKINNTKDPIKYE